MDETNLPLWIAATSGSGLPALEGERQVDVAIVGAGITGLTAAFLLKQAGKRVAVVDQFDVGCRETGHTTAHLTEIVDTRYHDLHSRFGREGATQVAASSRAAIHQIDSMARDLGIDCDFQRVPAYLYAESQSDVQSLKAELQSVRDAGIEAEWVDRVPLPFKTKGAIKLTHQAQFHPRKYVLGLAKAIQGKGSHVFVQTHVSDIREAEPCEIITERGRILAREVIVAANVPINNRFLLHTKISAYRTYALGIIASEPLEEVALFWDTEDPYHYIRTHVIDGQPVLIVGGEDHKTGTKEHTERCFERLEKYARARFPVRRIEYRWSGQIIHPVDGLPYIGRNSLSQNLYVSTGYTGNGMTFGTLGGMLMADAILGKTGDWARLYDATRIKPFSSAVDYVSENKDFPTYLLWDRIKPASGRLEDISPGEGKVVQVGKQKVAVYRDEEGKTHALSPVCPHLGCLVHFNDTEKTWDCPCHGSRFDWQGKVLNGPALSHLPPIELDEFPEPETFASPRPHSRTPEKT